MQCVSYNCFWYYPSKAIGGATVAILIVIALAIIMTYVLFFIPNGTTADGKQKRGNGNYALIILAIILVVLGFGTFIG